MGHFAYCPWTEALSVDLYPSLHATYCLRPPLYGFNGLVRALREEAEIPRLFLPFWEKGLETSPFFREHRRPLSILFIAVSTTNSSRPLGQDR